MVSSSATGHKWATTVEHAGIKTSSIRSVSVRHILVRTQGMADLVYDRLREPGQSSPDPFGDLARSVSDCEFSRGSGGRIGWFDGPASPSPPSSPSATDGIVPDAALFDVLFGPSVRVPKPGDVRVASSARGVHVIRIDDVSVSFDPRLLRDGKGNLRPRRLKGGGTAPALPFGGSSEGDPPSFDGLTYEIRTSGCQMNVADTERMEGELRRLGMTPSAGEEGDDTPPNVVVLNTCTIRDHAEQKVYDALGPLAARRRKGDSLAVIVAGCVAQQEGEALLRRVPEVDAVVGPQYAGKLGELLTNMAMHRGSHQLVATDPTLVAEDLSMPVRSSSTRAWVNVIYGCNEHCSYCVVPNVRGVEQSRTIEAICKEMATLAEAGYKEVTLLGQNIDAYGRDMSPKTTFADLLYAANNVQGIERVRYVTSHPRYFSDRVIDAVANLDKVCECFHVPFQAGDDEVLRRMRRGYTFDSYMKIINKIKKEAPDASICGDVIVGFPGETDEAFQRTLDLMNEVKFDNLNTFAYSKRPNTEAAKYPDQVPDSVKAERLQIVQRLAVTHATERSERYLDRVVEVLVEEVNPRNPSQVMGRTRQGRQVYFDGALEDLEGRLVDVRVTEARPWSLSGERA